MIILTDHEAIFDARLGEANVSRAQTLKAHSARKHHLPVRLLRAYARVLYILGSREPCAGPRSDIFISPLEDIYFVTELLGTDLHRLLTSRPLEKQFIQYFLYQILVRCHSPFLFSLIIF